MVPGKKRCELDVGADPRVEALSKLWLITKHDAESRPLIADVGAVPFLAETLFSPSHSTQVDAAATLLNLSSLHLRQR